MEVCAITDHSLSSDTVPGDKTDDIPLRGVAASPAGLSLVWPCLPHNVCIVAWS